MLLEFRVKNYRTYKEEACFSMIASNYDKTELERLRMSSRKRNLISEY
jgi:AAA15 family ATPase/GTPase